MYGMHFTLVPVKLTVSTASIGKINVKAIVKATARVVAVHKRFFFVVIFDFFIVFLLILNEVKAIAASILENTTLGRFVYKTMFVVPTLADTMKRKTQKLENYRSHYLFSHQVLAIAGSASPKAIAQWSEVWYFCLFGRQ